MRLLVDTHAFLWTASEPSRLSERVRALIADPTNLLYLSHASVWEIAIKHKTGKLILPNEPSIWVPMRAARHFMSDLPIKIEHVFRAGSLPLHHRDPFDRLLVAQAQVEGLTLLTADSRLSAYDVPVILATE